jgi:hypothetical protein
MPPNERGGNRYSVPKEPLNKSEFKGFAFRQLLFRGFSTLEEKQKWLL